MKIVRKNYGQGSGKQEQILEEDELSIDRLVYRKLGSLTDNKTLTVPDDMSTEFNRFLLDMNNLHNKIYYDNVDREPTPDIVALDEYLGSLGDTEEYPFPQDTYDQKLWLDTKIVPEYRILIDETNNTVLTDGEYILVSYKNT